MGTRTTVVCWCFEHLNMLFACTGLNLSERMVFEFFFFAVSNFSDMTLEFTGVYKAFLGSELLVC